jgi:hypothetical protein
LSSMRKTCFERCLSKSNLFLIFSQNWWYFSRLLWYIWYSLFHLLRFSMIKEEASSLADISSSFVKFRH